ncbi:DUF421 domain-containing protein [Risungbinella massiliensis]|uniref:DUF421 domain-containing protein n=1 Tax=Risungbinella massiliensis TaxID=1329796 RepID=UPI0005CBE674|nr:DUF421 domain-containing protein [Risungbinella massiliensis]
MDIWVSVLRTIFLYFFIILIMRLMGKREIGQLSVFDLIVFFMIAEISVFLLEDSNMPLLTGLAPMITLVVLQIACSMILLKSSKLRRLVDGDPVFLIKKGHIQDKQMEKLRYNMDDLMQQLREKNIANLADVEFAILEPSGKLSVFPKEEVQPPSRKELLPTIAKKFVLPTAVILDGKVQKEGLEEINQTIFWLKQQIQKQGYKDFKEIFYASYHPNDEELYIDPKDS